MANFVLESVVSFLLCFLRHLSEQAAFETLAIAEPFLNRVVAVGLDSSEQGRPPKKFSQVFSRSVVRTADDCSCW